MQMRLVSAFVMLSTALPGLFMLSSCLQSNDLFLPVSCLLKANLFKMHCCNALTSLTFPVCASGSRLRSWLTEQLSISEDRGVLHEPPFLPDALKMQYLT